VALCSAALCSVPMMAQGGGGGRMQMTPEARVAAIDKAVTLTDDQKTKITAIYTADMKKMADLRASQDPDMRSKMMAMRTDENTQIKALLTDDQKPKFDAYVASMPQGRGGGGGQGGGGAAPPPPQQ
jgi:protein CpxP